MITVFGTAGDVLPCISVADAMREQGHEVIFACPRWLGLYARTAGFRTIAIGDGSERAALEDSDMYSLRFNGFASWRQAMNRYVYPLMASSESDLLREARSFAPDLVVVTALGYWGVLIANALGVSWASFHLYPQLCELSRKPVARGSGRFGGSLALWLRDKELELGLERSAMPVLDWPIAKNGVFLAHDPAVYVPADNGFSVLGFPYLDSVFHNPEALNRALEFVDRRSDPCVVVSFGSFLGLVERGLWPKVAEVCREVNCAFVLVGLDEIERSRFQAFENVHASPHLPLSQLLGRADLFVHHGGIGTMYAGIQMGVPSLICPLAFDQGYNCRLLESAGVGRRLDTAAGRWAAQIRSVLDTESLTVKANSLAGQLVSPADAAQQIASGLLGAR